jgi:phosphoenolpyruvate carboxylase
MTLVEHARAASDLDVLRAYLSHYDPGMWLTRSGRARNEARSKELALLSTTVEGMGLHDRMARLTRRLQADYLDLTKAVRPHAAVDRETIILAHILRLALMQRTYLLATHIPEFSPQQGTTRELLVERILHLDVEAVIDRLRRIFPLEDATDAATLAFVAPASYMPDATSGYEAEHRTIFEPMLAHYEQSRAVSSALTYLIGAVG